MNNSKYRGVVVPMVTPVTQDGQLDIEAVKRIIDFFANNKVSLERAIVSVRLTVNYLSIRR